MSEDQARVSGDDTIKKFATKTVIIALAVVLSIWFVLDQLDSMVEARIAQISTIVETRVADIGKHLPTFRPKTFWPKLEADIEKAADPANDLSPEKRAKLMAAIRILADRWVPLLAEASDDVSRAAAAERR